MHIAQGRHDVSQYIHLILVVNVYLSVQISCLVPTTVRTLNLGPVAVGSIFPFGCV